MEVKLRLARRSISRAELESLYTEGVPAKILFSGIGCVGTQTREEETFSRICRFSRAFPRNRLSCGWFRNWCLRLGKLDVKRVSAGLGFWFPNYEIRIKLGSSAGTIQLNNEAEHDLTNVGNSDSLQTPANTLSNHTELDIYVGNISAATTAEKLMAEFGHYGLVIDAKVVKKAGISYGFAKFEDPENSFAAIQALNGKVIDGNAWRVEKVHKNKKQMREVEIRGAMEEGRVLYASNLSYQVKDSDLERFFGQFGDIVACRIRRLSDGRSRGDAFIEYSTKESVARAILAMEGKTVWGRPIYVGLGKINP